MSDVVPKPEPSPQPAITPPSKRPTRELDVRELSQHVKKDQKRRPWYYGVVGLLTTGAVGTGGYGIARGESQDVKNVRYETGIAQNSKAIERLDAGQTEAGKRLGRVERKVDKLDVKLELMLDALKVSKDKRPKGDDE